MERFIGGVDVTKINHLLSKNKTYKGNEFELELVTIIEKLIENDI